MRRNIPDSAIIHVALLSVSLFLSGCASLITNPGRLLKKEPEFVRPGKVIPVWSDTVLHQSGQPGQRGCGGRIMFYAGDGKRAVRVDGALMIYAWDDSKPTKERQPDRKYLFRADDLQNHFSESSIGDSYSFWIPWDAAGGERKELTLVARFVGRDGAEVTSTPAKVILPGSIPLPPQADASDADSEKVAAAGDTKPASGIQQVSYQQPAHQTDALSASPITEPGNTALKPSAFRASEIPLTEGFLRRNMQNGAGRAYTPGDLFGNSPARPISTPTESQQLWQEQTHDPQEEQTQLHSNNPTQPASAAADVSATAQPADYSLRFRDRVRSSREAQRSVDRALSERYQSTLRRAPWEYN
ncbi:MAG: hypothetical protein RIK87_11695 [Fuerstiella sp.]